MKFKNEDVAHNQSCGVPKSVIFDTDLGNDIDDVLALQMLLNYEKEGKINLLGITISKSNPYVVEYIDAYCIFNNYPDIPLGYAYNGVTTDDGKYLRQTLNKIVNGKKLLQPQRSLEKSNILEGYKLMRKLLSSQPDSSVILITVGPLTNLGRLITSKADEYSTLSGIELINKKVKFISTMSGLFSNKFDFPEWNIVQDIKAAKLLFEKCPVQVVASGWEVGNELPFPYQSILNDFGNPDEHPLTVSYQLYDKMPYDRPTWDMTAVLYAIEPDSVFFNLSPNGKIHINRIGKSFFIPSEKGKQHFLLIEESQKKRTLNALVRRVIPNKNHDIVNILY